MIDARGQDGTALRELENRLLRLQQAEPESPEDFRRTATALAALERDRFLESHLRRTSVPGGTEFPQALSPHGDAPDAEGTLEVAEIAGALETWRAFCEREGFHAPQDECQEALRRWRFRRAAAWRAETLAAIDGASDEDLFELLLDTLRLERETDLEEGDREASEILRRTKLSIRERIEYRISDRSPGSKLLSQWRRATVDRAAAAIADAEESELEPAIRHLQAAEEDVLWHLDRIDKPYGGSGRPLTRRLASLRAEREERTVQLRLETAFGRRVVAWFERLVFVLLFVLTGLLLVEWFADPTPTQRFWLDVGDLAICSVFLTEFFVKWRFAAWSASWFKRHWLIDLLPAIPVGVALSFIEHAQAANWLQAGRWLRLLRLSQGIRYLRALLPLLKTLRAVAFFARGIDRIGRRYARLMNRDVILYPNRDEMEAALGPSPRHALDERFFEREIRQVWRRAVEDAPAELRPDLASLRATSLGALLDEAMERYGVAPRSTASIEAQEITASRLLERMASVAPEELDSLFDPRTVSRIAQLARCASYVPTAWFGWASFVPARTALTDSEVAAIACRKAAATLSKWHDAAYWAADLHGTISPSLFIDRVGTLMVKNSARPATRLALFGGGYLIVIGILRIVPIDALTPVELFLRKFVGTTLLALGSICLVVFTIGWWLRQIAKEATEFFDRFAQAQFLALTETIRERRRKSDLRLLYERVLHAEWSLAAPETDADRDRRLALLEQSLASATRERHDAADALALARTERAGLLYRDWLDGALFVDNDCRVTAQLLGNPCLQQFYEMSHRIPKRELRRLERLDLERLRTFDGPSRWFHRISRSISHALAALLAEYNRSAVPLEEIGLLDVESRERHRRWALREEAGDEKAASAKRASKPDATRDRYVTNAFHALHFLDDDPLRDEEIALRFGEATLARLRADRVHLIRTVFGTAPLHDRPREERVFNAYLAYRRHVERGRWLLAPLRVATWSARKAGGGLRWTAKTIGEIRRPDRSCRTRTELAPDFLAAVRKIDRVRRPIALAATGLRSLVDPEYLGAAIPLREREAGSGTDLEQDLAFLRPDSTFEEEQRDQRLRAAADMARVEKLIEGGLLGRLAERLDVPADSLRTPETIRTIAVAYYADLDGVRVFLSSAEILHEATERTQLLHAFGPVRWKNLLLGRAFREWAKLRDLAPAARRLAWRAVVHDVWDAGDALRVRDRLGESARAEGERRLAELLRHPGRVDEYLMSLRTIQTLALLDVAYYRRQVYRLGDYAESGIDFSDRLSWMGRNWGETDQPSHPPAPRPRLDPAPRESDLRPV
ncbi:MAG TPA: ion transporter [Pirellulaceae bacterium]|jgi:hypothetical protein|nr:ion transporter [Pirellulaceae bacterium]